MKKINYAIAILFAFLLFGCGKETTAPIIKSEYRIPTEQDAKNIMKELVEIEYDEWSEKIKQRNAEKLNQLTEQQYDSSFCNHDLEDMINYNGLFYEYAKTADFKEIFSRLEKINIKKDVNEANPLNVLYERISIQNIGTAWVDEHCIGGYSYRIIGENLYIYETRLYFKKK